MTGIEHFKLDPEKQTLFVFGGSQGSAAINNNVRECAGNLTEKGFQLLWQTGPGMYADLKKFDSMEIRTLPFINEMKEAYAAADLVLCRGGALTISELTLCCKPSVLVPLKSAAGDHQTKNARALEKAGAAMIIKEEELSPEKLTDTVTNLFNDQGKLEKMRLQTAKMGKPNAVKEIAGHIIEIARS